MMSSRGIRRKKSTTCEVKMAVIGFPGVGKTALTVRFLTRRYIGEYDHQQAGTHPDNRYKYEFIVDGEPVLFEILDTCPKSPDDLPSVDTVQWADGLFMVYSITDRETFNYVRKVRETLQPDMPLCLVGNKCDMVHLRQVSQEEGEILAKDFECPFFEVTAAEQVTQVRDVFYELCREVIAVRRKSKQSLLDRMLGGKSAAARAYSRGKSDSALPKD